MLLFLATIFIFAVTIDQLRIYLWSKIFVKIYRTTLGQIHDYFHL